MTTEALDFYAYWNGAQVADLWTTLALITGTDDYRSLLLCVALFGLICAAAGAAVRYRGGDLIVWIAAMVFIFSAAFVPRVNIAVRDVRSANVQVVQNIPLGIGWPASVISRASYWLTKSFETAFGDVDAARYTRFGVAFSYTMSDADYRRGKADMDVYSLAAYGLWMGENGQFADVVARLGTAKTDMTVDGNKKGSMDNIVTALSGEFGWRFDLSKSFYLEPQVELAYTHVDADVLSLSDGSTYRFDDADSLMGRAGFAFGMRCPENGSTAYLRVSAVHEFLGDNAVIGGNGKVYDIDGKDTWVEYGLGANFNLTDSTYVWADVERTSGGYLDEDWRATVGVRHAF